VALQHDLVRLEQWAKCWAMMFNASKCHTMHIGHSSSSQQYMYQLCGVILSLVTTILRNIRESISIMIRNGHITLTR